MTRRTTYALLGGFLGLGMSGSALATIPYTPVALPVGAYPAIGAGVITPDLVFGKEYSHGLDNSTVGLGGVPDPEQVIAWDGIGGTADGVDFSGSRGTNFFDSEVDAIANHQDALFKNLFDPTAPRSPFPDTAHLIFSIDDTVARYVPAPTGGMALETPSTIPTVPTTGPVLLSGGTIIGGSGDVSIEEAGVFGGYAAQGIWAPAPTVNGMPVPVDVDGVEVWGPEPALTDDSDKYSLDVDVTGGGSVSIWNYDSTTGTSSPYITQAEIVAAVSALLGPVPSTAGASDTQGFPGLEAINVDALMVYDTVGDIDIFDRTDVTGPGNGPADAIIFSIRQVVDPADPDGYYATGSELFVMDGSGFIGFLEHGGHAWDHAYAISDLAIVGLPDDSRAYIDINAIEAIGELIAVPEPASVVLASLGMLLVGRRSVG